jgi:hypothetical protein
MRNFIVCVSLGFTLLSNAVPAKSAVPETISVRLRASYQVCTGFCPNFTMTVGPSGQVTSRPLWGGKAHHYTVSGAQLEAFRHTLDALRPTGERELDRSCEPSRTPEGTPDPLDKPRPDDLEVRWSGPSSRARLSSCGYTHPSVRQTVESAVKALGANLRDGAQELAQ